MKIARGLIKYYFTIRIPKKYIRLRRVVTEVVVW